MNERFKELRNHLGLNQEEFGVRMKISRSHISSLENGAREITDRVIYDACREFNVNEHWLRTGEGEMFKENDDTIISELVKEYQLDDLDKKLLEHYLQLSEEDRKAIKSYVFSLSKHMTEQPDETAASTMESALEKIAAEDAERYRLERLAELKGEITSSASKKPDKKIG